MAVLLATRDGERFLPGQIGSILAQTHGDWVLHASDDGSVDGTWALLEDVRRRRPGRVRIRRRERPLGFGPNFLSLALDRSVDADFFAFADQDDEWFPDKLRTALGALEGGAASGPALYGSRTEHVDEAGRSLGLSPPLTGRPGFRNALVQCLAGGNTMVFNRAARELLLEAGGGDVYAHDWWLYMVVAGCGGRIVCDGRPSLRYRQHGGNAVGGTFSSPRAMLRNIRRFKDQVPLWNDRHVELLRGIRHLLTPENRSVLDAFAGARRRPLAARALGVRGSGVFRRTFMGNVSLAVATLLGKI